MPSICARKGGKYSKGGRCVLKLIASTRNRRGHPTKYPSIQDGLDTEYVIVDVTSSQPKVSKNRVFSPLLGTRMEAGWQSCKIYKGIDHAKDLKWWESKKEHGEKCPRRSQLVIQYKKKNVNNKYPTEIGYVCPESGKVLLTKADARREIYSKLYKKMVLESEDGQKRMEDFRELMLEHKARQQALTIIVKDNDGPRADNGEESWCEYNADVHEKKLNDTRFSFGHGYCVLEALERMGKEVFGEE